MNKEETQQKIQNRNTEPSPKQTMNNTTTNPESATNPELLRLKSGMTTGSRM